RLTASILVRKGRGATRVLVTENIVTPGKESKMNHDPTEPDPRCPSGVEGFDEILNGGLPRDCFYLVQGDPGSGKTTLALQFLLEGLRRGESGFYVTLSE